MGSLTAGGEGEATARRSVRWRLAIRGADGGLSQQSEALSAEVCDVLAGVKAA